MRAVLERRLDGTDVVDVLQRLQRAFVVRVDHPVALFIDSGSIQVGLGQPLPDEINAAVGQEMVVQIEVADSFFCYLGHAFRELQTVLLKFAWSENKGGSHMFFVRPQR